MHLLFEIILVTFSAKGKLKIDFTWRIYVKKRNPISNKHRREICHITIHWYFTGMRIFIINIRKSHDLIIWTLSYKTWALIKTACRRNNRYYDSCIWMGNIISCIKCSCNSSGGGASRQKVVKGVVKQRTGIICLFLDFECEWIGTRLKIQFDNGNYVIVRQGCMPTNYGT